MRKKTPTSAKSIPATASTRSKVMVASVAAIPSRNGSCVGEEDIRLRAYQKWEAAGKPAGDGVNFWVEAERELRAAH